MKEEAKKDDAYIKERWKSKPLNVHTELDFMKDDIHGILKILILVLCLL